MILQLTISREQMGIQPTTTYTRYGCSLDIVKPGLSVTPSTPNKRASCAIDFNHPRLEAIATSELNEEIIDIYFGRIYRGRSAYQAAVDGGYSGTEEEFNKTLSNIDKIKKEDLADGAVTTPKIFSRAVTSEKIALQAVTAEHIAPQSITEEHLSQELLDKINDDAGYVWAFAEAQQQAVEEEKTTTNIYRR